MHTINTINNEFCGGCDAAPCEREVHGEDNHVVIGYDAGSWFLSAPEHLSTHTTHNDAMRTAEELFPGLPMFHEANGGGCLGEFEESPYSDAEEMADYFNCTEEHAEYLISFYSDNFSDDATPENIADQYEGEYSSLREYVLELDDAGVINENNERYFDHDALARDLELSGEYYLDTGAPDAPVVWRMI